MADSRRLPDPPTIRQRRVATFLHHFPGRSPQQIGEALDLGIGEVYNTLGALQPRYIFRIGDTYTLRTGREGWTPGDEPVESAAEAAPRSEYDPAGEAVQYADTAEAAL